MNLISILSGKYFHFNTLYSNQSSLGHWASRDVAHEGDVVVSLAGLAPLATPPRVSLLLSSPELAGADHFLDNSVNSYQVLLYHQENCYPANKIHNLLLHKNWRTHLKISFLSSVMSIPSFLYQWKFTFLLRYLSQLTGRGWGRGWHQAGWSADNARWPALNTCPESSPSPRPPSKQLLESPPVINVLE